MYRYYQTKPEDNTYLKMGIFASIVFHVIFFLYLSNPISLPPLPEKVIEISFEMPEPPPPQMKSSSQIVDSPTAQQEETKVDDAAKYLSDKDFSTEKEQIRRGDDPNAGAVVSKERNALPPAPPAQRMVEKPSQATTKKEPVKVEKPAPQQHEELQPKPAEHKNAPLKDLLLDDKTLLQKFSTTSSQAKAAQANRNPLDQTAATGNYAAFSRPPGSGAALIGFGGSNNYLPNLPDGDITLLNTKANRFAVFVRRVATQVFSEMRRSGWENLSPGDIGRIETYTVVNATLDKTGKLISVKIEASSGSPRFDSVLQQAVKVGASDPNPPIEALADDGYFHFIFQSQSWSRRANNQRTGAPFERRWLLLATGLE